MGLIRALMPSGLLTDADLINEELQESHRTLREDVWWRLAVQAS